MNNKPTISYKHIMPSVLKIKNGFRGSVVISILVTDKNIDIISARKPTPEDLSIEESDDEHPQEIKGIKNYFG